MKRRGQEDKNGLLNDFAVLKGVKIVANIKKTSVEGLFHLQGHNICMHHV